MEEIEGDALKSKWGIIPMRKDEDERREAALASAAPLQPTFKPPPGVSHQQLSKFQELHTRRLLIKSKSKTCHEKKGKRPTKTPDTNNCIPTDIVKTPVHEESGIVCTTNNKLEESASLQSDDGSSSHVSKRQRHKLHWGLDTKKRWEMKANM